MPQLETIIDALSGKREGSSYRCTCPVHQGASLIVTERDGVVLVKCQGGCEQSAVIAELRKHGLWDSPDLRPAPVPAPALTWETDYEYLDEQGNLVAVHERYKTFGGKTFKWRLAGRERGSGLAGLKESTLPLYGAAMARERLKDVCYVVEGEKSALACAAVGLVGLSLPGGASQKDFGQALELLRGRQVVLWPDNDDAGRELMRRVGEALEGKAGSVRFLMPDVPPKGDAADYFGAGGTVAELDQYLARQRSEPWLEPLLDGYLVSIPESGGYARFSFQGMHKSGRNIETDNLSIWLDLAGVTRESFDVRMTNIMSLTGRTEVRRALDDMFGKEWGWTAKLNRACKMAHEAHFNRDDSVVLIEAEKTEEAYVLYPFVVTDGPAILFGQGGSGKTWLALYIAVCASLGLPMLGQQPLQVPILIVDYESTASAMRKRMELIMAGLGMTDSLPAVFYWPGRGIPLVDQVPALERKIRVEGIRLIIVDSAVLAAGADPEKADTAARYFSGLSALAIPSLTIAHVTKANDMQYPFGSVFYHNSARITWNAQLVHDEQADGTMHIGLFNRKPHAEGRPHKNIGVRVRFGVGDVAFENEDPGVEWEAERSAWERMRELLDRGGQTAGEMADALALAQNTIKVNIQRHRQELVPVGGGRWGLIRI